MHPCNTVKVIILRVSERILIFCKLISKQRGQVAKVSNYISSCLTEILGYKSRYVYFKISYLKSCFDMKPFLLMSSASHKPIWFRQSLNMVIEKIIYYELICLGKCHKTYFFSFEQLKRYKKNQKTKQIFIIQSSTSKLSQNHIDRWDA